MLYRYLYCIVLHFIVLELDFGLVRAREGNNPGKVRAGKRYTQRISKIHREFRAGVREHPGKVRAGNRYTQ